MATVRYRADWTTKDGYQYRIDIHDADYDSTPNDLDIGMDSLDGFTLNYQSESTDLFNPIISSECIINCVAEDATFESFIEDLVDAQEGRFRVAIYIYESSAWRIFWAGPVLQDQVQIEDVQLPYLFQLNASDGIGRLKDVEYPGTEKTFETFISYLVNIIEIAGVSDLWSTNSILQTGVQWYEGSMFTTTPASNLDPLAVSRVNNQAYMSVNDNGDVETLSAFEVLKQIATQWQATFMLTDGMYRFIQLNHMAGATINVREYDSTGTVSGGDTALDITTTAFLREGTYNFLPSLNHSVIKYAYKQSVYATNLLPQQQEYPVAVSFGSVQGGNDETLIFYGIVHCNFRGVWEAVHAWKFSMMLRVGSYYYTNENGYDEWTTSSSARYIMITQYRHSNGSYTMSQIFTLETDSIPNSGEGFFMFDFVEFIDHFGNTLTPPGGSTYYHLCEDFTINQNIADEIESGEDEFICENQDALGDPVESSSILDFDTINTGDGYHDYSDGRIQVYTPSSTWINSDEDWTISGSGTGININQLLVDQAVLRQKSPRRVYGGTLIGTTEVIVPGKVYDFGDRIFVFRSGMFNANFNELQGDFVQLSVESGNTSQKSNHIPNKTTGIFKTVGTAGQIRQLSEYMTKRTLSEVVQPNTTLQTADYTIKEGDNILYVLPAASGVIISLPVYDDTTYQMYRIINASATYSITIKREDTGDLINGAALNYTLNADSALTIHNSGISAIGWATLDNSNRK